MQKIIRPLVIAAALVAFVPAVALAQSGAGAGAVTGGFAFAEAVVDDDEPCIAMPTITASTAAAPPAAIRNRERVCGGGSVRSKYVVGTTSPST